MTVIVESPRAPGRSRFGVVHGALRLATSARRVCRTFDDTLHGGRRRESSQASSISIRRRSRRTSARGLRSPRASSVRRHAAWRSSSRVLAHHVDPDSAKFTARFSSRLPLATCFERSTTLCMTVAVESPRGPGRSRFAQFTPRFSSRLPPAACFERSATLCMAVAVESSRAPIRSRFGEVRGALHLATSARRVRRAFDDPLHGGRRRESSRARSISIRRSSRRTLAWNSTRQPRRAFCGDLSGGRCQAWARIRPIQTGRSSGRWRRQVRAADPEPERQHLIRPSYPSACVPGPVSYFVSGRPSKNSLPQLRRLRDPTWSQVGWPHRSGAGAERQSTFAVHPNHRSHCTCRLGRAVRRGGRSLAAKTAGSARSSARTLVIAVQGAPPREREACASPQLELAAALRPGARSRSRCGAACAPPRASASCRTCRGRPRGR
jgi:hypothetical protein